jgi:hypothetical protein
MQSAMLDDRILFVRTTRIGHGKSSVCLSDSDRDPFPSACQSFIPIRMLWSRHKLNSRAHREDRLQIIGVFVAQTDATSRVGRGDV